MKAGLIFLSILASGGLAAQVPCETYLDTGPLDRMSGLGEERVAPGIYEAVAQRYNNINGSVSSVVFRVRVNPANIAGNLSNTIKVKIYYVNPGFGGIPGIKITNGEASVSVDTAYSLKEVTAIFTPPVTVNDTNIIISIEPGAQSTDDFFVGHNADGDGAGMKLILIKQAAQWFNNPGAGFNYDFLILPKTVENTDASFTFTAAHDTVTFNNTSSGTSYRWEFGDGNTSTAASPVHIYGTADTFTVRLVAFSSDSSCSDTITNQVITTLPTGVALRKQKKSAFLVMTGPLGERIMVYSGQAAEFTIWHVSGAAILSGFLRADCWNEIGTSMLPTGFFVIVSGGCAGRFLIARESPH